MNRSIWLAANAPEILLSTFPNHRVLNNVFIYFSSWAIDLDDTLVYESLDLSVADAEGVTMDLQTLLSTLGALMYSDYAGEIRISNAQAQALQVLPHWSVFLGDYTDKDELQTDVIASGLAPLDLTKDIDVLIVDAQTALFIALG